MTSTAMKLPFSEADTDTNRTAWFGRFACVVHGDESVNVFVSGFLIGSFAPTDVLAET